jgi:hypothetical protein
MIKDLKAGQIWTDSRHNDALQVISVSDKTMVIRIIKDPGNFWSNARLDGREIEIDRSMVNEIDWELTYPPGYGTPLYKALNG